MVNSVAIVTACNDAYLPLLADLVQSLADSGNDRDADLCVLDVGLGREGRRRVEAIAHKTVTPGWDFEVPAHARLSRPYRRAMTARPMLPRHFPGYDVIVWLDADSWVQEPHSIAEIAAAARRSGFAICPELDLGYVAGGGAQWFARHHIAAFTHHFDAALAASLADRAMLNSGVFGARSDSPIWERWQRAGATLFRESVEYMIEQCALNAVIYASAPDLCEILPAQFNWLCGTSLPAWDAAQRKLVHPIFRSRPLAILHLAGPMAKSTTPQQLAVCGGGEVAVDLHYGAFRRFAEAPASPRDRPDDAFAWPIVDHARIGADVRSAPGRLTDAQRRLITAAIAGDDGTLSGAAAAAVVELERLKRSRSGLVRQLVKTIVAKHRKRSSAQ